MPFKKRRCLILASGFYEWQKLNSKTKQPWNISRADGAPMMAGLWEQWKSPEGETIESCAIITTEATGFMAELHDRMPLILHRAVWGLWLDPDELPADIPKDLLVPCPDDWLEKYRASTIVGNVRNKTPDCIKRLETSPTLF